MAGSGDLVPVWRVLPEYADGAGALLVMRDGSFRMILRVGSVNFDMKSDTEKAGISNAFGQMLNSLQPGTGMQIFLHSKRLDSGAYMRQFEARLADPNLPPALRQIIEDRLRHFEYQVLSNNLLKRDFYIVLPHEGAYDPVGERLTDNIPGAAIFNAFLRIGAKKVEGLGEMHIDPLDIDVARQQLDLRAQQITGFLEQLGIRSERLGAEEVRTLFYELYHPGLAERQKITLGPARAPQGARGLLGDGSDGLERRRGAAEPPAANPMFAATRLGQRPSLG